MVETTFHAFQMTYSPPKDMTATEYEEIRKFLQKAFFYYAAKAEDVKGQGKVHFHFMGIKLEGTENPSHRKDIRYGPTRISHLKELFWKQCPTCLKTITNKKVALAVSHLSSTIVLEYYNKETHCVDSHLPPDMCVIKRYLAADHPVQKNKGILAHCERYTELNFPLPATIHSVWEYLNHRWFDLNDCETVSLEQHQKALVHKILTQLNRTRGASLPLPSGLKEPAPPKKKPVRLTPSQLLDQMEAELFPVTGLLNH